MNIWLGLILPFVIALVSNYFAFKLLIKFFEMQTDKLWTSHKILDLQVQELAIKVAMQEMEKKS